MLRMTVGFFISASLVWFWFRFLPKKEKIGSLPHAFAYFIPCWIFFGGISWFLRFFFIDRPFPTDQLFLGWYAEGMSYLITAVFLFTVVGGKAGHVLRHKQKIPPCNLSEKIDDFFDPPSPDFNNYL